MKTVESIAKSLNGKKIILSIKDYILKKLEYACSDLATVQNAVNNEQSCSQSY